MNDINSYMTAFEILKELDSVQTAWVLLEKLKQEKPNDRSILDKRYAVLITDFEKILAYMDMFLLEGDFFDGEQVSE